MSFPVAFCQVSSLKAQENCHYEIRNMGVVNIQDSNITLANITIVMPIITWSILSRLQIDMSPKKVSTGSLKYWAEPKLEDSDFLSNMSGYTNRKGFQCEDINS